MAIEVVITDLSNVKVLDNGELKASGSITDVIENYKVGDIKSILKDALTDFHATEKTKVDDSGKAQITTLNEQIETKDAEIAELKLKIKEKDALIDVLGGTEVGKQLAKQKEYEATLAAKLQKEQEKKVGKK